MAAGVLLDSDEAGDAAAFGEDFADAMAGALGGYEAQAAIVTPDTKKAMQQLLTNIQDGSFAKKFINENETGRHGFAKYREAERNHPVEKIGATLRPSMPFLDPIKIVDGHPVKA